MIPVAKRPPRRSLTWPAVTLLPYLLALVVLAQPARASVLSPQPYNQDESDDYDYASGAILSLDILNAGPARAPAVAPPASSPASPASRTTAQPSGNWRNPATAPWIRALMAFLRH
jgi:hypothetical protein